MEGGQVTPMAKIENAKEKSQLLTALLEQAAKKGFIQSETILKKFARYRLNEEEKEDIFLEFERAGIQIVFPEVLDEDLIDEPDYIPGYDEPEISSIDESSAGLDSIQQYIQEIHQFPVLTYKETLHLVREIQKGNSKAREKMINCNLKYAFSIATKYAHIGFPLLDLVQQANIGLMAAVDKYNPNRGTKFTTYSVFWIKQAIFSYIEEHSRLIKMPSYITTAIKKINAAQEEYYIENQTFPSDDEIATITGFSIARVKHLKNLQYSMASLDSPVSDEMDGTLMDTIQDCDVIDPVRNVNLQERKEAIQHFLSKLTDRERKVLILRYGLFGEEKHSLEKTGEILSLTMERVRQIESRALTKIREMRGSYALKNFIKL